MNLGHGLCQGSYVCKMLWICDVIAIPSPYSSVYVCACSHTYTDFCSSHRRRDALVEDRDCMPAACSADRKTEEEERKWRGAEQGREADKAGERRKGGEGPPLSSIAVPSEPTKGTFPHTHHGQPANQSAHILDPSSLVQLLIHGSAKQMWGDAVGSEAANHLEI